LPIRHQVIAATALYHANIFTMPITARDTNSTSQNKKQFTKTTRS
jgi:hypothetical protein